LVPSDGHGARWSLLIAPSCVSRTFEMSDTKLAQLFLHQMQQLALSSCVVALDCEPSRQHGRETIWAITGSSSASRSITCPVPEAESDRAACIKSRSCFRPRARTGSITSRVRTNLMSASPRKPISNALSDGKVARIFGSPERVIDRADLAQVQPDGIIGVIGRQGRRNLCWLAPSCPDDRVALAFVW
jgi:hypothetical protein